MIKSVNYNRLFGGGPSPVFKALRDGLDHEDRFVELRREMYEDIFARLEAVGVPRDDLQLAWDYTTASTARTEPDASF